MVANACILVLGEIATPEAVQALGRIKLNVRDERLTKQIAKAMDEAAKRAGVTVADLQEISVPTFDLEEVGVQVAPLGEFTATLRVISTTDVAVELTRADGKPVKSLPSKPIRQRARHSSNSRTPPRRLPRRCRCIANVLNRST
jgi:hypothetical protein